MASASQFAAPLARPDQAIDGSLRQMESSNFFPRLAVQWNVIVRVSVLIAAVVACTGAPSCGDSMGDCSGGPNCGNGGPPGAWASGPGAPPARRVGYTTKLQGRSAKQRGRTNARHSPHG